MKYFTDDYTTASIHENTVGREVARIESEVNRHHHTKTCRKHDTTCRFNYPRYPAPDTIIVTPCEGSSQEDIDADLARYRIVLRKVRDVLEDEEQMNKIMNQYKKQKETKKEYKENIKLRIEALVKVAGVDYNDYLRALGTSKTGYSIVQQRDLDEININSYNIEWMRAWNGNMDIQVVLDYFAVITNVTDYYSKDDTGTMEVIKAALEQSDAKEVKDKMRLVSMHSPTNGRSRDGVQTVTKYDAKEVKCCLPVGLIREKGRKNITMETCNSKDGRQ